MKRLFILSPSSSASQNRQVPKFVPRPRLEAHGGPRLTRPKTPYLGDPPLISAHSSNAGTDLMVRCFFVQAHTTVHLKQIPEGNDRLTFTTGLNLVDGDTFAWHPSYSEFERTLAFNEQHDSDGVRYHSIRVTLHSVPSGNARTRSISREQFLKGHPHS